jgi:nickel/cobalt transporter (NiCoT) family protein
VSQPASNISAIGSRALWARGIGILSALIAANLLCWMLALLIFAERPLLIGTAVLAYTLGLRHAVDADHIAAIDNVTRSMMQAGKRPLAVGLFFSLGHSTVVFTASAAIAVSVSAMQWRLDAFKEIGGVIGTAVSATFLLIIGFANLLVLISVWRRLRHSPAQDVSTDELAGFEAPNGGLITRLFGSRFRLITRSWQMYPLGFLFGLGFDTATEIALLGIAASQSSQGLPLWSILLFPALFTAGMSLIDTADGFLMIGAYGWALEQPSRRLYYNFAVTLVSVLIALFVGGIEALGLIGDKLSLGGGIWRVFAAASENFGALGYVVIALFVLIWTASWAISWAIGRLQRA